MTRHNRRLTIESALIADEFCGCAPLRGKLEKGCDNPAHNIVTKHRPRQNRVDSSLIVWEKRSKRLVNSALFTIATHQSAGLI